ncbi:hypothetical protein CEXT_651871 [Caerostris extrusa]|uniref:Secreted protein n=1 Tax=Caerostris extrusa TaxID=172846 RepID=A0AAV4X9D6_CAEEX|nr:hypothetical protein CEXT_651871 [Caerostris extrusa]
MIFTFVASSALFSHLYNLHRGRMRQSLTKSRILLTNMRNFAALKTSARWRWSTDGTHPSSSIGWRERLGHSVCAEQPEKSVLTRESSCQIPQRSE